MSEERRKSERDRIEDTTARVRLLPSHLASSSNVRTCLPSSCQSHLSYNRPIVMSPFTRAVKWTSTSRSSSMLILRLLSFFSPSVTYIIFQSVDKLIFRSATSTYRVATSAASTWLPASCYVVLCCIGRGQSSSCWIAATAACEDHFH